MTTSISPSRFRTVIVLAGIGAVAPYIYASYYYASFLYKALRSPTVSAASLLNTAFGFRQFLAPLAWAFFFFFLYGRVSGSISSRWFRMAAAVALLVMAASAAFFAWEGFAILGSVPGATGTLRRILIAQLALYLPILICWCALFAVFAVLTDPLVNRLTSRLALLTLSLTLIACIGSVSGILSNWFRTATPPVSLLRAALASLQISGSLLVCLFLAALWRGVKPALLYHYSGGEPVGAAANGSSVRRRPRR